MGKVNLYSGQILAVTSAVLYLPSGQVKAQRVTPGNLAVGENTLDLDFGPLQGLVKGSYYVDMTLSDGSVLRIYLVY